ncbi:MAG: hypothetical protein WAY93_10020 [Atopobiaceae bacterium]|jgi:tellurite resistance protein|nr:hypothetical protein [Atopobiaceae bacterium]
MADFMGFDLDGLKKTIDNGAKAVQEGAKSIDLDKVSQTLTDAATEGANLASRAVGDVKEGFARTQEQPVEPADDGVALNEAFVRMMVYLAAADGDVTQSERTKLAEIGRGLDAGFDEYGNKLMDECLKQIESDREEFGQLNAVKMGAKSIISGLSMNAQEKKVLYWDLLTIAGLDGFDEEEIDFLRFVSAKLDLDPVLLQEMKNYYGTVVDLENERAKISRSNHPFKDIEPIAKEFDARSAAVSDAIRALIEDE